MQHIIGVNNPQYITRWSGAGVNRFNGAYYYAKEIEKNIIPRVETNRNWVLLNVPGVCYDHSLVFIHNNLHPENYKWLERYNDLVLVCGRPETQKKVKHLGKTIYLPLSVDVNEVKQYANPHKTKPMAFVGRPVKRRGVKFPDGCDFLENMPREKLLAAMAEYYEVFAVGRCAIEAKILGCHVLPYDERYPSPRIWRVLDNKDAAAILQKKLDKIDGIERG